MVTYISLKKEQHFNCSIVLCFLYYHIFHLWLLQDSLLHYFILYCPEPDIYIFMMPRIRSSWNMQADIVFWGTATRRCYKIWIDCLGIYWQMKWNKVLKSLLMQWSKKYNYLYYSAVCRFSMPRNLFGNKPLKESRMHTKN